MRRFQQTKHALGSDALITLVSDNEPIELFSLLWQTVSSFEAHFSRFLATSELSYVNKMAGTKTLVTAEFRQLLKHSIELSIKTDGLYNPLTLPALQQAGYVGSWPNVTKVSPDVDYRKRVLHQAAEIKLGKTDITLPEESALDFGGIGKGYLLDQLAKIIEKHGIENFWLSLGGDLYVSGADVNDEPWQVGIANAQDPKNHIRETSGAHPYALATSGTTKRKGKGWHHIIDPRTGKPAVTDVLTATVKHEYATEADVYAKCLVILGSDEAMKWAKKHQIHVWLQTEKRNNKEAE